MDYDALLLTGIVVAAFSGVAIGRWLVRHVRIRLYRGRHHHR